MNKSLHRLLIEHTPDPTDIVQVDIHTTADAVNLGPHVHVFVKDNTQVAHLISGWNQPVSNTDDRDGELPFLLRWHNYNKLCLQVVDHQFVLQHPGTNFHDALFNLEQDLWNLVCIGYLKAEV